MSPWRVTGYDCRLYPAKVRRVSDEDCEQCYHDAGLDPAMYKSCRQRMAVTEKEGGLR